MGARVAIVGSGGMGTPLVRMMKLPVPVLVDRDKRTYQAYGLGMALALIQMSATFLIDRDGIIRWRRASFNPQSSFNKNELGAALQSLP